MLIRSLARAQPEETLVSPCFPYAQIDQSMSENVFLHKGRLVVVVVVSVL